MRGVLQHVYTDEIWVVTANTVSDGSCLYLLWPFEVPPELGKDAIATCDMQTGVTACNANGFSGYKVGDQTRLEDRVCYQGAFDHA